MSDIEIRSEAAPTPVTSLKPSFSYWSNEDSENAEDDDDDDDEDEDEDDDDDDDDNDDDDDDDSLWFADELWSLGC